MYEFSRAEKDKFWRNWKMLKGHSFSSGEFPLSLCVCGVYSLLSVLSNFPFTAFFALNNPCIGTATAFCNHAVVIALLKPLTRFKLNLQLKCQHQMVNVSSNLNKQLLCPPRLRSGRHAPDVSVVLDDVSRRNPVHKFHN